MTFKLLACPQRVAVSKPNGRSELLTSSKAASEMPSGNISRFNEARSPEFKIQLC